MEIYSSFKVLSDDVYIKVICLIENLFKKEFWKYALQIKHQFLYSEYLEIFY